MKTALVVLAVLAGALFPLIASAQLPASQVVLENPSIRVTLLTFAPGGATADIRTSSRRSGSSSKASRRRYD